MAGLPSFCGQTGNAGKARFQGFEAEANARIGGGFSLSGTLGYIDAKFLEYVSLINGRATNVAQFRRVQNTPEFTSSATAAYTTPIGEGRIDASATWSYRSKTYQFEIPNPFIDQPGYSLFDANLVYRAPGGLWSLGLHGKNLFDKQYKTSGYVFIAGDPTTGVPTRNAAGNVIPSLGREGTLTAFYGNPRQIFGTLTLNF